MTFEAGGVQRTIRPTFDTLAALEQAIAESVSKEEFEKHGTGVALLLEEMPKPAPRMALIGRVMAVMMAKADPPLLEPDSHAAICEPGLVHWLVDGSQPRAWGLLPRFVYLTQYGPETLRKFLEEEESKADASDKEPPAKKPEGRSLSLGARLFKLLKFWE
jgi:hypothetical protein